MRELQVHNLPRQIAPEALGGSTVVVIDLLRATSTICQALAAGATEVVPFLEVDEALAAAAADRSNVVLGGERHGKRIAGFDLGNSPSEYTPASVGGKRVFITTTNGTRALYHARQAARVLAGSFLNLSALVASLQNAPRVDILCAGTDGEETKEDILAAGAIVHKLVGDPKIEWQPDKSAIAARRDWQALKFAERMTNKMLPELVEIALAESQGGRNLIQIGHHQDLADCAVVDALTVVPEFDIAAGRITAH